MQHTIWATGLPQLQSLVRMTVCPRQVQGSAKLDSWPKSVSSSTECRSIQKMILHCFLVRGYSGEFCVECLQRVQAKGHTASVLKRQCQIVSSFQFLRTVRKLLAKLNPEEPSSALRVWSCKCSGAWGVGSWVANYHACPPQIHFEQDRSRLQASALRAVQNTVCARVAWSRYRGITGTCEVARDLQ